MIVQRKLKNRTPVKQRRIMNSLREEIVKGVFPPGSQLPTRTNLEDKYQASRVTVQRVLDQLVADGFVYARGRNGTFVSERPPHLFQYGLWFPKRPGPHGEWNKFWRSLRNEADQFNRNGQQQIKVYYGPEQAIDDSFSELVSDIRSNRLAGLILATNPFHLLGSPVMELSSLPRVAIMPKQEFPGVAAIDLSYVSFFRRALKYLTAQGCTKPAVMLGKHNQFLRDRLSEELHASGSRPRPYWIQRIHPSMPDAAREIAQLMFSVPVAERPDSLIIADDHLVDYVVAGVVAAGVRVPDELKIVAHCNFPNTQISAIPMKRLGFDANLTLSLCLESLQKQRAGQFPMAVEEIDARFEDELPKFEHEIPVQAD
jgi:DNA-binding LacI/PurR family transcriptional regulator